MPKTNRKYCTPPRELRDWLEGEARRLNVNESSILVHALDRYRWEQTVMMRPAGREKPGAATLRLLYFEDDAYLAEMFVSKLRDAGFEVHHHEHPPKNVVELAIDARPDLILMDTIMPKMDGFEATEQLQADPRTRDVPVFGLSNLGQPEDIARAKQVGMRDYWVTAEHTPAEVIEQIRALIVTRHAL